MAWDDDKATGDELTADEWDNHVADQKDRAPITVSQTEPAVGPRGALWADFQVSPVKDFVRSTNATPNEKSMVIDGDKMLYSTSTSNPVTVVQYDIPSDTIDWTTDVTINNSYSDMAVDANYVHILGDRAFHRLSRVDGTLEESQDYSNVGPADGLFATSNGTYLWMVTGKDIVDARIYEINVGDYTTFTTSGTIEDSQPVSCITHDSSGNVYFGLEDLDEVRKISDVANATQDWKYSTANAPSELTWDSFNSQIYVLDLVEEVAALSPTGGGSAVWKTSIGGLDQDLIYSDNRDRVAALTNEEVVFLNPADGAETKRWPSGKLNLDSSAADIDFRGDVAWITDGSGLNRIVEENAYTLYVSDGNIWMTQF